MQSQQAEFAQEQAVDEAKALSELPGNGNVSTAAAAVAISSLALTLLLPVRFAMTWFPKVRVRKDMEV